MKQTLEVDELVLEQRLYQAVKELSTRQLADPPMVNVMVNHAAQKFLIEMRAKILTHDIEKKVYRVEEEPVYPDGRHAYLDSLPKRSFRRRFLGYFWGIDPDNVPAKRRIHEVTLDAFVAFPEYRVPDNMGRVIMRNELNADSYWVG
jgi:hypothetical protein